jgi:alcohol dehydrogenase
VTPGPFSIGRIPRIEFGAGTFAKVPRIAAAYGRRALLVTGGRSLESGPLWAALTAGLADAGVEWAHLRVAGEPSPELVDQAVREHAPGGFDVVLGVGGGSALDAAKAVAGLLRVGRSVRDYLEGVGPELSYEGPAVPLIAVPTTAGTGSEATRNAVLSVQGPGGFKKSFRDDRLVAEWAVVDPDLLATCPPPVLAANGMDAVTQLLESYVSTRANPLTDALALSGLEAARDGLLRWFEAGGPHPEAQARMAYASLLSGVCLAQTGLGSVHGLASPLGAFFPIPHGVVCGTLVGACTAVNLQALRARDRGGVALARYGRVGEILSRRTFDSRNEAGDALVRLLDEWTERLPLPRLGHYGLTAGDLDRVVAASRGSSMKTNPIILTDAEVRDCLERRI